MRPAAIDTSIKIGDTLVFIVCSILVVVSYFHFWQLAPASVAVVRNHLNETLRINLQQEQRYTVQGLLGESTLQVKNGQVRFISSPCRNKICIQSGWHQHSGELTACLPNRISVQLASLSGDVIYDAINF